MAFLYFLDAEINFTILSTEGFQILKILIPFIKILSTKENCLLNSQEAKNVCVYLIRSMSLAFRLFASVESLPNLKVCGDRMHVFLYLSSRCPWKTLFAPFCTPLLLAFAWACGFFWNLTPYFSVHFSPFKINCLSSLRACAFKLETKRKKNKKKHTVLLAILCFSRGCSILFKLLAYLLQFFLFCCPWTLRPLASLRPLRKSLCLACLLDCSPLIRSW